MKQGTTIQERLWELRKDKGLNLEELSKLTGISKSALGNYEKDDYKEINHGNLIILAKYYDVSTDYLLCLTENKKHANCTANYCCRGTERKFGSCRKIQRQSSGKTGYALLQAARH